MIDGLRLTISGAELRERLEAQICRHQSCVEHYKQELTRADDDQTAEDPPLPEHILEHERDAHIDRIEALTFIRDHVMVSEIYRLGEVDLRFGELIPQADDRS